MNDSVLIAVPTRGQVQWQTVTRLEEIRDSRPGMPPIVYQEGNLSVAQTRNRIVKRFMETACDVLVMVDDDTVPSPHFLDSVLPVADGFGMVGLPYPVVQNGEIGFWAWKDGEIAELSDGLNECDALTTGCVAIPRSVFAALGPAPFRLDDDPDGEFTSDDSQFCHDLRAAGFKIGCWWDGWYADHVRTVSLAPLMESRLRRLLPSTSEVPQ